MLLPLRGVPRQGRLRQDVRFEEIRFALVGQKLRQAAHADA